MTKIHKNQKRVRRDKKVETRADSYEEHLNLAKTQSTLQLLFKTARVTNDWALSRNSSLNPNRAPGLRAPHMSLLPHIDLTGTRVTTLAERVGVSKQAVSELVDEMVSMGHLTRAPDPTDGRAKLVMFTAAGRQGILDGLALLQQLEGELARTIGAKSMQNLHQTLAAVLAVLEGALASTSKSDAL